MNAKVSGLTVGLKVCGNGNPSRSIFMLDLLKDKPYMHFNSPDRRRLRRREDENNDPPPLMEEYDSDDESNDDSAPDKQLGTQSVGDDYGTLHPNTIVQPVETRPIEELRDGARRTSRRKRTRQQSYINESYSSLTRLVPIPVPIV
jgi:hypothetical protein